MMPESDWKLESRRRAIAKCFPRPDFLWAESSPSCIIWIFMEPVSPIS